MVKSWAPQQVVPSNGAKYAVVSYQTRGYLAWQPTFLSFHKTGAKGARARKLLIKELDVVYLVRQLPVIKVPLKRVTY